MAVIGDKVVGFIRVDEGYIGWLYIDPSNYGNEIGRLLLKAGVEQMNVKAWTTALAGNLRALNFYQNEGFQQVNRYESDNARYPCTCVRLEREIQANKIS